MTTSPIAITGATGRIGGRVAQRLSAKGAPLRLLVRDLGRAPDLPGAQAVLAPFADGALVQEALTGVEVAFMVSASEDAERVGQHPAFVDAAAAAGVRHLVYLSFRGASEGSTFTFARDHAATEAHIRDSGMAWTFLRDGFYADFMPGLVGEDGVIRGPGGDGRVAVVARDDIADAAAAVLADPGAHARRTYTLTGPAALSFNDIASIVGEVQGRQVTYVDETPGGGPGLPRLLRRPRLGGGGVDLDVHRDRRRRARRGDRGRRGAHRAPGDAPARRAAPRRLTAAAGGRGRLSPRRARPERCAACSGPCRARAR
ncbi:NmrA family NAD(P)-binding protein [Janibacter limosus]|uniref:NmrA family NAD(P)-binding protein n=1 Tax=Janibacter limosus TaxID=53458 RepID=UPI0035E03929